MVIGKMEIDCIIQARMGSERLPGKVLLDLTNGKKTIDFLFEQLKSSKLKKKITLI